MSIDLSKMGDHVKEVIHMDARKAGVKMYPPQEDNQRIAEYFVDKVAKYGLMSVNWNPPGEVHVYVGLPERFNPHREEIEQSIAPRKLVIENEAKIAHLLRGK